MKRHILAVFCCTFAQFSHAVDITIGANFWQETPKGNYGEASDALIDFSNEGGDVSELFGSLEHSFPILPNVRYATSDISNQTTLTLDKTFILGNQNYSVASSLETTYKQQVTDYTLFYEAFDNRILELDLGVTFRQLDASLSASNLDDVLQSSSSGASHSISMAYGSMKMNLPLLGLRFGTMVNYRNNETYDLELSTDFFFPMIPVIDPYVTLGVRKHKSEVSYSSGLFVQQDWETVFLGVGVEF